MKQAHLKDFFFKWTKLFAITGGAQVIIQALGFLGGILIVRYLSTKEYAIYTLSNTILSAMILMTDGGISAGVLSQGGSVWNVRDKLGSVLISAIRLRKRFAYFSMAISIPFFVFLLQYHTVSWYYTIIIVASILPVFYFTLTGALYEIALKLNQDIVTLQKIQLRASVEKLLTQFPALFFFPFSYLIVLANSIPQFLANRKLFARAAFYADLSMPADTDIEKNMLKIVNRTMPGTIYYCFSSQIMIWLVSIFGTTTNIAQLGALGRFSMIFNLFNAVFATIVLSQFARLANESKLILKSYLYILTGLFMFNLLVLCSVWMFSDTLLLLLGDKYSGLSRELILSIAAGALGLISASTYSLFTVKGWAINPLVSIPISLLSIVMGIFVVDLTKLTGVLYLNLFVSFIQLIMYISYGLFKIFELKKSEH